MSEVGSVNSCLTANRNELPAPEAGLRNITSSYTFVYSDKVAHISISADETPYGVVIEDAGVAAMQRLLFGQLWTTL